MTGDTILLVTASYDHTATDVAGALTRRGAKWFRFNTDHFPTQIRGFIDQRGHAGISTSEGELTYSAIKSIWYRRHVDPILPVTLKPGEANLCQRESQAFINGFLYALRAKLWVSDALAIRLAEPKPFQLGVAAGLGFTVPPTLVTNDPGLVRQFARGHQLVAKAVSSGYVSATDGNRAIFTSLVQEEDLNHLDELCLAPVIFQHWVAKSADIRVTVVGRRIFATEILSQGSPSSAVDWRATDDPKLEHRRHSLPTPVQDACRRLVTQLGLRFGAIDLALTPDGSYMFFEINPNGEWAWIEDRVGHPIAASIAALLDGEDV